LDEPISDAARSILDGHVVLSRRLATKGHYPAIDVLESVSRLKNEVTDEGQKKKSEEILELMAVYRESEDLINIGAYEAGSNPKVDEAIARNDEINSYLKQNFTHRSDFENSKTSLLNMTYEEE